MSLRESAIAKLQHLPESLVQEISDFIDFVTAKHSGLTKFSDPESRLADQWSIWFREVDSLDIKPIQPTTEYEHCLIEKYRQQGLEL
jgi:hypothetical protein